MPVILGILAHVDAGKTTLSEQLLYRRQAIRTLGRVDDKNAFLDGHPIERERGITIFSGQAVFELEGQTYYLIDTPGHVDFSSEMERALQVLDVCIVVISAVEGIQGHTRTILELLSRYQIPTLFFINKIDRDTADPEGVLKALERMGYPVCRMDAARSAGEMDEQLCELLAGLDEQLMEGYFAQSLTASDWRTALQRLVAQRKLFPCFFGAALTGDGVETLTKGLSTLCVEAGHLQDEVFGGRVYQVRRDASGNRLCLIKIMQGVLQNRDVVTYQTQDGRTKAEKVNELKLCQGSKYLPVGQAKAGDLCAVSGLSAAAPGMGLGATTGQVTPVVVPLLRVQVSYPEAISPITVLGYFRQLEEEDPLLQVQFDEQLGTIGLHVMGLIQLEILQRIVAERFGLKVTFSDCQVLYQETIAHTVTGYGHFEPLRHYAEVHLRLEPAPRGSGIAFESACSLDVLTLNWQNLVRTHVFERVHKGVLLGMPLTDVKLTLLTGRAHEKHTEGGDFRQATYRAIRQGLEQAETVVLEPFYRYRLTLPPDTLGRAMSDIQRMCGSFEAPEVSGEMMTLSGRVPVACFLQYPTEVPAYTGGQGSVQYQYDGYDVCHNQQEVIERIGYDKLRDTEHTSDSIFCAKGAGYAVGWREAKAHMHCL